MDKRNFSAGLLLAAGLLVFASTSAVAGVSCYRYEYAPNLVRAAQKLLKEKNLYKGTVDGKWGPRTKDAVARFQELQKITFASSILREDNRGQLEERTLKALFGDDAPEGVTVVSNPHRAPDRAWLDSCQ